jgi:hypothetical protein
MVMPARLSCPPAVSNNEQHNRFCYQDEVGDCVHSPYPLKAGGYRFPIVRSPCDPVMEIDENRGRRPSDKCPIGQQDDPNEGVDWGQNQPPAATNNRHLDPLWTKRK